MPTLQGSGAISLENVRANFGGGYPVSMSQYYRGGGRVPSSRTVNYTAQDGPVYLRFGGTFVTGRSNGNFHNFWWYNSRIAEGVNGTSVYSGGYTYFRGTLRDSAYDQYTAAFDYWYEIYRQYPASYQEAINGGVPTGGQISMSNFYGATT